MKSKNTQQKGMIGTGGMILIGVLVVGGLVYWYSGRQSIFDEMDEHIDETLVGDMNNHMDEVMGENESLREDELATYHDRYIAGNIEAPLVEFNQAGYKYALASDKLIVLYFYANWCPTCRAEFPLLEDVFDQNTTANIIGFRVNFNDNETDSDEKALAKEFGVAYQHTKVFVKNGERVLKSPEGWDTSRYLREINNFR
jgi:thiol-disulfide isomerase/thioredoxin